MSSWTTEQYSFCIDRLIEGESCEKIAAAMTRLFKRTFSRNSVIARLNRDFGGTEILLNNILTAWPTEPQAEKIEILLRKKYGGRRA